MTPINLGDLEYRAEDFMGLDINPSRFSQTRYGLSREQAEQFAGKANAILREKLGKAPEVLRMQIPLWMEKHAHDLETVTHTARLVCIEETKK